MSEPLAATAPLYDVFTAPMRRKTSQTSGKAALVTGASRGIGRTIALALAKRGMNIVLLARNRSKLEGVAALCRENAGVRTVVLSCDVRDGVGCATAIAAAHRDLGRLDVLVNNAGVYIHQEVQDLNLPDCDQVLDVNIKSLFHLTTSTLPYIRVNRGGAIINICSVSGTRPKGGTSVYAASKQAALAFSRALFQELRGEGIKVSAICPGYVATEMALGRSLSLERCMRPSDIARAVVYVLTQSHRACPTEIVLEPQISPIES